MSKRFLDFIYPKKEHKMKKYIPAFILVIVVTSLMTFIIYDATVVYEKYQIPMKIKVSTVDLFKRNLFFSGVRFFRKACFKVE